MKRYFTLLEVLMVVVILGIIATIGIPLYRGTVERAKAKACESNLKVIHAAVEVYGLENDILPATLSQLEPRHFQKAWARVLKKENGLLIKIANCIVDFDQRGMAYAQEGFLGRYLKGESKYVVCPSDMTPYPSGVSYGLNAYLKGMSFKDFNVLQQSRGGVLLVADCDQPFFSSLSDLASRHTHVRGLGMQKPFVNLLLVTGVTVPLAQESLQGIVKQSESGTPPAKVDSPWTTPVENTNPDLGDGPVQPEKPVQLSQIPQLPATVDISGGGKNNGDPVQIAPSLKSSVQAGALVSSGAPKKNAHWKPGATGGSGSRSSQSSSCTMKKKKVCFLFICWSVYECK